MGKRGPAKTPTAILEARGSWLAKTRKDEPQAEGVPLCLDWLTDEGKLAWNRLIPMLRGIGVVGAVDENALARYCDMLARWKLCVQFVNENGMTHPVRGPNGQITMFREFAEVDRASRLSDQLLRIEQQFGMTPASRASLAIDTTKQPKEPRGKERFFMPKLVNRD
jgi:P27 family predicted phage terminase small subunit